MIRENADKLNLNILLRPSAQQKMEIMIHHIIIKDMQKLNKRKSLKSIWNQNKNQIMRWKNQERIIRLIHLNCSRKAVAVIKNI